MIFSSVFVWDFCFSFSWSVVFVIWIWRREIQRLLKEQEEMQQMLGICNSFSCLQQDCDNSRSLRALLKQEDMLDEALRKEKLHQEELDKQVNKIIFTLATLWEVPVTFSSCKLSSRNSIIPLVHCCLHFHSSLQSMTNHTKEIADPFADPLVRASLAIVVFIFSIVLVWLLQFPTELFTDMMYSQHNKLCCCPMIHFLVSILHFRLLLDIICIWV